MSQHDFVIDNAPGLSVRTDIMAAIKALASCSLGPVQPTTMYAGQLWLDTSNPTTYPNGLIKQRNAGNTGWVGLMIDVDRLIGLPATPLGDTDATSKKYVDTQITATNIADGGTVTGDVVIENSTPQIALKRIASTEACIFASIDETGKYMWRNYAGSGTGKDWLLYRYDSAGTLIDSPLWVDWSGGRVTIDNGLTVNGGGIVLASGGVSTDNVTRKQGAADQILYDSWVNFEGRTQWAWRMEDTIKQFDLRCYRGSDGAYLTTSISCDSDDGRVSFPAGVDGAMTVRSPGATDSPYVALWQGGTQRGYIRYLNATGMQFVNDVTDDYLLLSNVDNIDALQFSYAGVEYPILHRGNAFYTGSSVSNTSYPVGSIVYAYYNNQALARNAAATVRLSSDSWHFELQGSGAVLAGTWRARGQHSDAILMQRVA